VGMAASPAPSQSMNAGTSLVNGTRSGLAFSQENNVRRL